MKVKEEEEEKRLKQLRDMDYMKRRKMVELKNRT